MTIHRTKKKQKFNKNPLVICLQQPVTDYSGHMTFHKHFYSLSENRSFLHRLSTQTNSASDLVRLSILQMFALIIIIIIL